MPSNAILLEDGSNLLLEDGSDLLDESPGTATNTATASLTLTPALSASRVHGNVRAASLTLSPSFSASRSRLVPRSASLTLAPVLGATAAEAASASLTVSPVLSAGAELGDQRTASLTLAPVLGASTFQDHVRSASLTVSPVFAAATTEPASASLTLTPSFAAAGGRPHPVSASLTLAPVLSAADTAKHVRAASLTVTPVLASAAARFRFRSASLTVTPALASAATHRNVRTASLILTPVLAATRKHIAKLHASLTLTPVLLATTAHVIGAPPGYPDGDLGARFELQLGGTWTDITDNALPDGQENGSIKSGQAASAQQPSPTALNGTWDNPDYSLSPRNSAGPYYGQLRQNTPARVSFNSPYGAYLWLEADNSDRAFVNDTSALHVTGSLELRIGARVSDWRGCVLAARVDNTLPSWYWVMNPDGTLTLYWYDSGGTQRHVQSPAAAAVSWLAFRVTLDATNGNVQFYVSTDIDGTWTSMGAAASGTSGSATTVRAGNAPLVVGWSTSITGSQLHGQVYGFRMYSGIGGTVIADAAFDARPEGSTTWTDTPGLTWNLAGGAELTARDYRLYGEVASLAPTADTSSSLPRTAAQLAGRLRRLQQGYAPTVESPMRRAVLAQTGALVPVGYWTMEDGKVAASFGPAIGTQLMTVSPATVQAAADGTFEASGPLPTLNGATLVATVDTYTGATAWAVRFLCKIGQLPVSGTPEVLASVALASGTIRRVDVVVDSTGSIGLAGYNSGGSSVFTTTRFAYDLTDPKWVSVEGTVSGGNTIFNFITLAPGASSGSQLGGTLPSTSGSPANVSSVTINSDAFFTDTVVGHLSVQKSWATLFALGQPLNAWRTELAANRFARVCAEQGINCRILGRPSVTQAMGAQPRGSAWTILRDCAQTEQGLIFEPADVFGVAFRTRESMGSQSAGLTLDFSASNLRGDLQALDGDDGLLNDVTASMPDGTTWRSVLNDGSARSVSEPEDGGAGTYAGSPPFTLNLADANQLQAATERYLAIHSVDEPRFSNIVGNFGIPGAPAASMARLRPGDLIVITTVPDLYQSADIRQLVTGATEAFGPGRAITWDAVPASPYS